MFLRELTESVSSLSGAGPAFVRAADRLGIRTVADLLTYYPRDHQDRRRVVPLVEAAGNRAAVLVEVVGHRFVGSGSGRTLLLAVRDDSATGSLLCFNRPFLRRAMPEGSRHYVYGTFTVAGSELRAVSFEHEPWSATPRYFLKMLPVYRLTQGLTQAALRRVVEAALASALAEVEDELPAYLRETAGLQAKADAVREAHFPRDPRSLEAARRTLKYEELVHFHLSVALQSSGARAANSGGAPRGRRRAASGLRDELLRRLPFSLTPDQLRALGEIEADLLSPAPRTRLLQGDVGCGKTLVALLACLTPIDAGEQVALMAPTELLARQHAESASRLLEPMGVRVALLTSAVGGSARRLLEKALAGGDRGGVDLVVGTHALFSEGLAFRELGFVVIDEQQRFGVAQRRELVAKGGDPDVLLMTATPIPRTLALTVFGDLEVSEIRSMPSGRKPISTHLAREGNESKVYERVRVELERGRQAYFVYPLIEESEDLGLKDAERMFRLLGEKVYPSWPCTLIHSGVEEAEKEARMARFASGEARVLVATSVVEVGVDVANATCMVVEHADRFGLSALHQLRGRVGRGEHQSYAFLIYSRDLSEAALERLRVMKQTSDGFQIAEEDLRLRGPGALLGYQQAGRFRLGVADLSADLDLVVQTRSIVRSLLAKDASLSRPEHAVLLRALRSATGENEQHPPDGAPEGVGKRPTGLSGG